MTWMHLVLARNTEALKRRRVSPERTSVLAPSSTSVVFSGAKVWYGRRPGPYAGALMPPGFYPRRGVAWGKSSSTAFQSTPKVQVGSSVDGLVGKECGREC